jgi:hypothetical protein
MHSGLPFGPLAASRICRGRKGLRETVVTLPSVRSRRRLVSDPDPTRTPEPNLDIVRWLSGCLVDGQTHRQSQDVERNVAHTNGESLE